MRKSEDMSAGVQKRMLAVLDGAGLSDNRGSDMEWDSLFIDELSTLVDVNADLFQDVECNDFANNEFQAEATMKKVAGFLDIHRRIRSDYRDEQWGQDTNFDDLDFTADLIQWNSCPLSEQHYYGDCLKPEFSSPEPSLAAVSTYSTQPLSLDSPGVLMSTESFNFGDSRSPRSAEQPKEKPAGPTQATSIKQKKLPLLVPKLPIQPKAKLMPTAADMQPVTGTPSKTVIFQSFTTLLPKQQPIITIQPTALEGRQVLLSPPATVQLPSLAAPASITLNGATSQLTTPPINILPHTGINTSLSMKPFIPTSVQNDCESDVNVVRRQQRMIKNRESAFQSRQKKRDYMQSLELRLRTALSENEKLKGENGSLQKLLEEVVSENQKLKSSTTKRRALCLMMIAVILIINFSPYSILESSSGNFNMEVTTVRHNRHLLEFSSHEEIRKTKDSPQHHTGHQNLISTGKALMVVKEEPLLYIPPPCQPLNNETEYLRLNQELYGWMHRHEIERKSRRMTSAHKVQAMQKPHRKDGASQLVTFQYTDASVKNSNQLQIYYSTRHSYQNLFEAIQRKGDTFYVVSFRRDHLLLPATYRNKTIRPKISIILPSTNVNENVINGQKYEVMMQIDCEVVDTQILHVNSAFVPQFLRDKRQNQTDPFYRSASSSSKQARVLSDISESPI